MLKGSKVMFIMNGSMFTNKLDCSDIQNLCIRVRGRYYSGIQKDSIDFRLANTHR